MNRVLLFCIAAAAIWVAQTLRLATGLPSSSLYAFAATPASVARPTRPPPTRRPTPTPRPPTPTPRPPTRPPTPTPTPKPTPTATPTPAGTTVAVIVPTLVSGSDKPTDAIVGKDPGVPKNADAKTRAFDLVQKNIKDALRLSGFSVVDASFLSPPQFTIVPTLRFSDADSSKRKKQTAILTLLVRGHDLAQVGTAHSYDISDKVLSDSTLTVNQVVDILEAPAAARRASLVVINEGPRDTQTAGTSFSGPAFSEARFIAQLLELNFRAVTAAEFLGAPSSSTAGTAVATTVDDLAKQICGIDPTVTMLRYNVIYDQTSNPLFSTQNATSTVYARAEKCGIAEKDWPAYRQTTLGRTFGNQGKLLPIYFGFANFLLSSGRNNKSFLGVLGKGGPIATSLLPDVASTSAQAIAVGYAADRVACQYAIDQLQQFFTADVFARAVADATQNRRRRPFTPVGSTQDDLRGDPCHAARDIEYQLRYLRAPAPVTKGSLTSVPSPSPVPSSLLKGFSH
jgi:hypothetical protein